MLAWKRGLLVLAVLSTTGFVGGCATVFTGTTQAISIDSQPSGAACTLTRQGQRIASLETPGQITVSRSRRAIQVTCRKTDYQDTGDFLGAEREPASYANILVPLGVGTIVDSGSGARARYPATLIVRMVPVGPAGDPANLAPAHTAAANAFDGRYFGQFRSHTILPSFDPIQIDVQVVQGHGTGTAKTDACATPGNVTLEVTASGAVIGRFQLKDASCQDAIMTFSGEIKGDQMNVQIARRVEALLVKQH